MTVSTQFQTSPYLQEQRHFPYDSVSDLASQMDKTYIDIATKVNSRTIGLYALDFPIICGNAWFLHGQPQKQQSLRQIFAFTSLTSIPHGIKPGSLSQIAATTYGSFTDGTNWYGAIYASNVAIAGQVSFYIDSTFIVFRAGIGAPAISTGLIVLEWISQF